MHLKKIHRVLGLVLLLPLIGWAATGLVFLVKPGYAEAYQGLLVRTYEIGAPVAIHPERGWDEVKVLRSILGLHLLVKKSGQFRNYDIETSKAAPAPTEGQVRLLMQDAVSANPERYGAIGVIDGLRATTSTGITIELDWDTMALSQEGADRRIIESLYRIHYLQWTNWKGVNRVLGVAGIICLFSLSAFGVISYLRSPRYGPRNRQ